MNYSKIIDLINDGKIDDKIRLMICDDDVSSERKRYNANFSWLNPFLFRNSLMR